MWVIILVSLGLLLLGFLLLGYISPYQGNKTNFFQIQEKEVKHLFETSNIQQYELTDEDKEWIEADLVEDDEDHVLDQVLNEIVEDIPEEEDKIENEEINQTLEKEIHNFTWKNIGLELYKETNLDVFFEKLNSLKNKRILIVTDVSYVLEADFKDHRVFIGFLKDFEILDDNTQDQPRIKFKVDIPVFDISIDLNWIYDKNKFDSDFSSEELVSNFLKTLKPVNELLLVEE
jgi:hypothetical protein